MFRPHGDPDARAPLNRPQLKFPIFEVQAWADQVGFVLRLRDPHRFGQVAGAPAELLIVGRRDTPSTHHIQSIDRCEGANEYRGRRSLGLGDDVHHPMDAVAEIHIGVPRFSIHRCVAACWTGRRVAGWIAFPDVRLDFDDGAAGADATALVDEHLA